MSDFETNQTQSLVNSIKENADALGLKWQLRVATVVFNANGIAAVVYDGDESDVDARAVPLIEGIYADDRVMVMHVPPSGNYIIGYAAAATGRGPGGRVGTTVRTSNTGSFTAETVMDSVTAHLVSGRIYRVAWAGAQFSTAADGMARLRIREDNISGTELQVINVQTAAQTANQAYQARMEAEFTAEATGNKTFVATMARQTGTGSLTGNASSLNPTYFYVDYVRG